MLKTLSVLFVFSILSLNLFALELEEAAEQVNNVNLLVNNTGNVQVNCPGDDNLLPAGTQGQFPGYNGAPIPDVSGGAINQLKSQTPCSSGGQRLPDLIFSTQSASAMGNTSSISGPFQQGEIDGTAVSTYAGLTYFGDIMIVTKMTNGTQVVGYNVILSMCTQQNLIMPGRQMTGLNAPFGIVLYDHTNCGFGNVDSALKTTMQAAQYQAYPATVIETTFGPACSSGYGY